MDENEKKLKSQLLKIEKEILVNYLVSLNKYTDLFPPDTVEAFLECTKQRQQSRKIDRLLNQIESGNYPKKLKKRVKRKIYESRRVKKIR